MSEGDLLKAQGRVQQALELDPHNVSASDRRWGYLVRGRRTGRTGPWCCMRQPWPGNPAGKIWRQRINLLLAKGVKYPLPDS